jgi:hypothetical protein
VPAIVTVIVIAVLAVAFVISLTLRRHGESDVRAGDWQRTDEVFRDPTTKRLMRVWVDPNDGSRHYVAEDGPAPSA